MCRINLYMLAFVILSSATVSDMNFFLSIHCHVNPGNEFDTKILFFDCKTSTIYKNALWHHRDRLLKGRNGTADRRLGDMIKNSLSHVIK